MKAVRAHPYRVPRQDLVIASPWLRTDGSGTHPLVDFVGDWDALTLLQLERSVSIDAGFREATRLPPGVPLLLAVTWHATGSGLRGSAWTDELPDEGAFAADVEFELPGRLLGGRLTLRTCVILQRTIAACGPAVAHLAGSMLWEDEWTARLQGDEPAFPITMLDFATSTTFDARAEWHLDISGDNSAAAMGALRLYVNTAYPSIAEAYSNVSSPTEAQALIISSIRMDIRRLMLQRALVVDREVDWPDGSLGQLLLHQLDTSLEGIDPESLPDLLLENPQQFDLLIRSEFGPVFSVSR